MYANVLLRGHDGLRFGRQDMRHPANAAYPATVPVSGKAAQIVPLKPPQIRMSQADVRTALACSEPIGLL